MNGTTAEAVVGSITFTMSATSHTPKVGESWTLTVTAARKDRPLTGTVHADVLFQGNRVAVMNNGRLNTDGYRHETAWPQKSSGYPLTIRVDAKTGGARQIFLFALEVQNTPAHSAPPQACSP